MRTIIISVILATSINSFAQFPVLDHYLTQLSEKNIVFPKIKSSCRHDTMDIDSRDTIIFTLNFVPDSTPHIHSTADFHLMSSSNSSQTTQMNDYIKSTATYNYIFSPTHYGRFCFPSPSFFYKGYAFKADSLPIYVKGGNNSKEYLKKKLLSDLIAMDEKPDNTEQLVILNDTGYYGTWKNGKFILLKQLDAGQILEINKIVK